MNPNRQCPRNDCRFRVVTQMQSCAYYEPIYDKFGTNLNPDGNVTMGELVCLSCLGKWKYKTQYDRTEYEQIGVCHEPSS